MAMYLGCFGLEEKRPSTDLRAQPSNKRNKVDRPPIGLPNYRESLVFAESIIAYELVLEVAFHSVIRMK